MKKFITIVFLSLAFVVNMKAQENAEADRYIDYSESWMTYTGDGINATTSSDSVWYYTILKESHQPLKYDIKVVLDSISGTFDSLSVYLQKKKFSSDDFANFDTVRWNLGSDTTVRFTVTQDTSYMDRYWRIEAVSDTSGFIFQVDELSIKFWE